MLEQARELQVPVAVVAGDADRDHLPADLPCTTLIERAGSVDIALRDAARLAADAAESLVASRQPAKPPV